MVINLYYGMNTPMVKVVTKYFILIDSFTPTNSIRLHLSLGKLCSFIQLSPMMKLFTSASSLRRDAS